ncbi:Suppressor of defective silencing 3-like [Balamuthia mandrillaris]
MEVMQQTQEKLPIGPIKEEQETKKSASSSSSSKMVVEEDASHQNGEDYNHQQLNGVAEEGMEVEDLEEKRKKDVLASMQKIEKEFEDVKEQLFANKIEALQKECKAIMEGTHSLFLEKVKVLEQEKEEKTWLAEKWKEYQLENIKHVYEAQKKQADDEFEEEKLRLRDQMANQILDKQKKLEEEKNMLSLRNGGETRGTKRMLRRRGAAPSKEPTLSINDKRKLNPPHINYTLTEEEIGQDFDILRTKLTHSERLKLFEEADSYIAPIAGLK